MIFKSLLTLTAAIAALAPIAAGYRVVRDINAPDGSYDYVSVDPDTGHVYVGRDFGIMVLNPITGRSRTLLARRQVAAVLPIDGSHLMLSTNGGSDTATLFDRYTGVVRADIRTGKGPDGAAYDPVSRQAFVMNGDDGTVTVIDIAHERAVGTIGLGGTPEGGVTDGAGHLFVNIEETNEIAVVDINRRAVTKRYALPGCEEPTGIARDAVSGLLIAACRNRVAKLVDKKSGADRGTLSVSARADGSVFDPVRRIGFIPGLLGELTIYRLGRNGTGTVIQTVSTREGARTAAYDTKRDRLYLPHATVERDAAGKYVRARSGFGVAVVGPAD
ncbi:MAG: hypothetical protein V4530_11670 [Pseudomonadota bacterium]